MTHAPVQLGEYGTAFAANLRTVRLALGVTVDELAAAVTARGWRMTGDHVTRIEAGQRRATADDICYLSKALDVRTVRMLVPSHVALVPNRALRRVFQDDQPGLEVLRG